ARGGPRDAAALNALDGNSPRPHITDLKPSRPSAPSRRPARQPSFSPWWWTQSMWDQGEFPLGPAPLLDRPQDLRLPLAGIGLEAGVAPVDLPEASVAFEGPGGHPRLQQIHALLELGIGADVPGGGAATAGQLGGLDATLAFDGCLHGDAGLEIDHVTLELVV